MQDIFQYDSDVDLFTNIERFGILFVAVCSFRFCVPDGQHRVRLLQFLLMGYFRPTTKGPVTKEQTLSDLLKVSDIKYNLNEEKAMEKWRKCQLFSLQKMSFGVVMLEEEPAGNLFSHELAAMKTFAMAYSGAQSLHKRIGFPDIVNSVIDELYSEENFEVLRFENHWKRHAPTWSNPDPHKAYTVPTIVTLCMLR